MRSILAKDGIVWLGSDENNIFKYDGEVWVNYPGDSTQPVITLALDGEKLLMGRADGFSIFYEGEFQRISSYTEIYDISVDNVVYWIVGDPGFWRYDVEAKTLSQVDMGLGESYLYSYFNAVAVDADKVIWIGHNDGLIEYSDEKAVLYKDHPVLKWAVIHEIAVDVHNTKWFATTSGLFSYDNNEWAKIISPVYHKLNTVDVDDDGNIWIGGEYELARYSPIQTDVAEQPASFSVNAPYPNPFNASVTIEYVIPHGGHVQCAVYDLLGRKVAVPQEGVLSAGTHRAVWDGRDAAGRDAASGTYFYRVEAAGLVESGKVMLVK